MPSEQKLAPLSESINKKLEQLGWPRGIIRVLSDKEKALIVIGTNKDGIPRRFDIMSDGTLYDERIEEQKQKSLQNIYHQSTSQESTTELTRKEKELQEITKKILGERKVEKNSTSLFERFLKR